MIIGMVALMVAALLSSCVTAATSYIQQRDYGVALSFDMAYGRRRSNDAGGEKVASRGVSRRKISASVSRHGGNEKRRASSWRMTSRQKRIMACRNVNRHMVA